MTDLRLFDRDKPLKLTSELQVATSKSASPDKHDKPAPFSCASQGKSETNSNALPRACL